jgi:hypothetical protein
MSRLYIKLFSAFFTHRKTVRLRARIGDDAFWIPPRLWAYAAENQPDGDFSGYTSEELAMLLGCDKHASSIRQALLEVGFLDSNGKIHDWEQHNGYHQAFSERAKAAAAARWGKKEKKQKKETEKEKDKDKETSIASSMQQACFKHESHSWFVDSVELPEPMRTDAWLNAIQTWLAYKREKRQSYKPKGLATAMAQWGRDFSSAEAFSDAVSRSVANAWAGVFPVKAQNGSMPGRYGTSTAPDAEF